MLGNLFGGSKTDMGASGSKGQTAREGWTPGSGEAANLRGGREMYTPGNAALGCLPSAFVLCMSQVAFSIHSKQQAWIVAAVGCRSGVAPAEC